MHQHLAAAYTTFVTQQLLSDATTCHIHLKVSPNFAGTAHNALDITCLVAHITEHAEINSLVLTSCSMSLMERKCEDHNNADYAGLIWAGSKCQELQ